MNKGSLESKETYGGKEVEEDQSVTQELTQNQETGCGEEMWVGDCCQIWGRAYVLALIMVSFQQRL